MPPARHGRMKGMSDRKALIDRVSDRVRRWFLWLLLGSYADWAQQAEGSMSLSLGLVLLSTLLSPLTTPLALHALGRAADGNFAEPLNEVAASGAGLFLIVCVVLPSLLGVLTRQAAGE